MVWCKHGVGELGIEHTCKVEFRSILGAPVWLAMLVAPTSFVLAAA